MEQQEYKNLLDRNYLGLFIFHMVFQYVKGFVPQGSTLLSVFHIEDAVVMILLVLIVPYEIYSKKKYYTEQKLPMPKITKYEICTYVLALICISIYFI